MKSAPSPAARVLIGKIVAAHGVRGLVKIQPLCENLSLLNGKLYFDETGTDVLDITIKSSAGKSLLAEVKGITDRDAAEKLKCSLFVSRETLPPPEHNEYYVSDLIGLDVYDGQKIGKIKAIDNFGAGDLIEIQPLSGPAFYIPFAGQYVTLVDLEAGQIIVQDIEAFQEN